MCNLTQLFLPSNDEYQLETLHFLFSLQKSLVIHERNKENQYHDGVLNLIKHCCSFIKLYIIVLDNHICFNFARFKDNIDKDSYMQRLLKKLIKH